MRKALLTAAAVVAAFVAVVVTAALVLPDAAGDPRLVPASGDEPPEERSVDEVCRGDRPSPAPPDIQTSAPRRTVEPGEQAQVGLRDRSGPSARPVAAEVTDPGGARTMMDARLDGTAWTFLDYPSDFPGAGGIRQTGTYRVRWRDGTGAALACDGFQVGARQ